MAYPAEDYLHLKLTPYRLKLVIFGLQEIAYGKRSGTYRADDRQVAFKLSLELSVLLGPLEMYEVKYEEHVKPMIGFKRCDCDFCTKTQVGTMGERIQKPLSIY